MLSGSVLCLLKTIPFVAFGLIVFPLQASPIGEIPFQFHDGFIWLRISTVSSPQPLNFLLDTGASASVLDLEVARRLGLKLGERVSVTGVNGTTEGYWPQKLNAMLGSIHLPKNYLGADLAKLGSECSTPIDGLLGMDFFDGKAVQIDFASQKIRMLDAKEAKQIAGEILPLQRRPCGMCIPVEINGGKPQWMRLDTGCASSLHWVTTNVSQENCSQRIAVALEEFSLPSTFAEVTLGKATFKDVLAGVYAQAIFPGEAGLLGNGILGRFAQVTIDTKAGRLILSDELNPRCANVRR
jgi:predicted aspartyl protease